MIKLPDIDINYLIQQVPTLSSVKFRHYPWERLGDRIAGELLDSGSGEKRGARAWQRTRWEMFRLIGTSDPLHVDARSRFENNPAASTGELVGQLANWLSELVDIPLSVASSLVSVVLFAIAERSVDDLLPSDGELVG